MSSALKQCGRTVHVESNKTKIQKGSLKLHKDGDSAEYHIRLQKMQLYRSIILQLLMPKPTKLNHHSWYDTEEHGRRKQNRT
jgi:hypothetical protein